MKSSDRLGWLDATRGLAVLMVLSAHTMDYFWQGYSQFIQIGNAGVVLFFLCSGYVIPISLKSSNVKNFWIRRFFRLFPLYWASIAIFLVLGMSNTYDVSSIIANVTMIQAYIDRPHISAIYWSLIVELTFYLFMSLMSALRLNQRIAGILIVLLCAIPIIMLFNVKLAGILLYLPVCIFGSLLYKIDNKKYNTRIVYLSLAALVLYLLFIPIHGAFKVGWLLALAIFIIIHKNQALFKPAWLIWCGQVSYSIYLLHGIPLHFSQGWALPLVFVIAFFSYHFIEKPGIQLGRTLTQSGSQQSYAHAHAQQ